MVIALKRCYGRIDLIWNWVSLSLRRFRSSRATAYGHIPQVKSITELEEKKKLEGEDDDGM